MRLPAVVTGTVMGLTSVLACGRLGFDDNGTRLDATTASMDVPVTVCPVTYGIELPGVESRYRYLGYIDYADAREACAADGHPLVIVDNLEEATGLLAFEPGSAWAGIDLVGAVWTRHDGAPATFLPWGPGQPQSTVEGAFVVLSTEPHFRGYDPAAATSLHAAYCECR